MSLPLAVTEGISFKDGNTGETRARLSEYLRRCQGNGSLLGNDRRHVNAETRVGNKDQ